MKVQNLELSPHTNEQLHMFEKFLRHDDMKPEKYFETDTKIQDQIKTLIFVLSLQNYFRIRKIFETSS